MIRMAKRLVLLHGWGADANDLRPLGDSLARQHGALEVMALDAPQLHPQPPGRQWYPLFPADWAAVPGAVQQLEQRLTQLVSPQAPLEHTVLFGFSQGGAMALHCGCNLPLAGVISCSGYPHPGWEPPSHHPPVLLMHGLDDAVVPSAAMQSIQDQLNPEQCTGLTFNNGHTIPSEMVQPMLDFLRRVLPSA